MDESQMMTSALTGYSDKWQENKNVAHKEIRIHSQRQTQAFMNQLETCKSNENYTMLCTLTVPCISEE